MTDPADATPLERLPLGYSAADAQRPLTWVVRIFAGGALAAAILTLIDTAAQITLILVSVPLDRMDNQVGLVMQIVQALAAGALLVAALGLLKMRRGWRFLAIGASIALLAVASIECFWMICRSSFGSDLMGAAATAYWISERTSAVLFLLVLIWFLTRRPVREFLEGAGV